MLEPHDDTNRTINGFALSALIDLRAVEAIETIRDAFRRNAVDLTIAGDTEDVEIELGLSDRRDTPALRYGCNRPAFGWAGARFPPRGATYTR